MGACRKGKRDVHLAGAVCVGGVDVRKDVALVCGSKMDCRVMRYVLRSLDENHGAHFLAMTGAGAKFAVTTCVIARNDARN